MDKINTSKFYMKSAIQILQDLKRDFIINNTLGDKTKNQDAGQNFRGQWPVSNVDSLITVTKAAYELNEKLGDEIRDYGHDRVYLDGQSKESKFIKPINTSGFTQKVLRRHDENTISPFVDSSRPRKSICSYDFSHTDYNNESAFLKENFKFSQPKRPLDFTVNDRHREEDTCEEEEDIDENIDEDESDPEYNEISNIRINKRGSKAIKKSCPLTRGKRRKRGKRGTYRRYTQDLKARAIRMAREIGDISKAAKKMGVPPKNLKRWIVSGPVRKKGGRKTQDPEMERKLFYWITGYASQYGSIPSSREIKSKALLYSKFKGTFKASKGWLEKFLSRHNLDKKNRKKLLEMTHRENFKEKYEKTPENSIEIFNKAVESTERKEHLDTPEGHIPSSLMIGDKINSFNNGRRLLDHNFLGD